MLNKVFGPHKLPLTQYEKRISQGSHIVLEEGIVDYLFSKIPTTKKFCVEFGAGDGTHWPFTRHLIREHGWGAFLIEGNPEWAKSLAKTYQDRDDVQSLQSFITAENIVSLFEKGKVPKDLDLLAIDIDGIDYYVWEKLEDYDPKVVCIEYNASWGANKKFVIDYDPEFIWQEDDYFGASFASLLELGREKGYEIIHCSTYGDNMFFMKREYLKLFPEIANFNKSFYQPPQYKKFGRGLNGKGHPVSTRTASRFYKEFCRARYYLMTPVRKLAYLSAAAEGIYVKKKLF